MSDNGGADNEIAAEWDAALAAYEAAREAYKKALQGLILHELLYSTDNALHIKWDPPRKRRREKKRKRR